MAQRRPGWSDVAVLALAGTSLVACGGSAGPPGGTSPAEARLAAAYGRLPVGFEPAAPGAPAGAFVARGGGYAVALSATEAVLSLGGGGEQRREEGLGGEELARREPAHDAAPPAVVRLRLLGADPAAPGAAEEKLPGVSNYFVGADPARWRTPHSTGWPPSSIRS